MDGFFLKAPIIAFDLMCFRVFLNKKTLISQKEIIIYIHFSSGNAADQDEDFVSDSYQASTSDIAEVDENMKKLVGMFFPNNI